MAQLVISAAAATVGWFVGGPTGAQIGWAVGSALSAPKIPGQHSAQPIMDLKVTGTEYGQPIPYVRGAAGIAGQVWWNTDRRPTTTTTVVSSGGGKGGGAEDSTSSTTTYDMDMLIGLANNEIAGIARIWSNGNLIYTAASGATSGSIAASAVTGLWTRLTVYTGSMTQLPDPTYEAAVGAANAPAYRGRAYVFIEGLKLGQSGQVPNLTFEVVADGSVGTGAIEDVFTGASVNDQYIPNIDTSIAGYPLSGEIWVNHYTGADTVTLLDMNAGTVVVTVPSSSFPSTQSMTVLAVDSAGDAMIRMAATGRLYKVTRAGAISYFTPTIDVGAYGLIIDSSGDVWGTQSNASGIIYRQSAIDYTAHTCTQTVVSGGNFSRFLRNAAGISGRIYGVLIGNNIGYVDTATMAVTAITSSGLAVHPAVVGADGNIYFIESGVLKKYDQDGAVLGSLAIPSSTKVYLYDSYGMVWTNGSAGFYKVNASTMAVDSTVSASGYTDIVAEIAGGVPAIYGLFTYRKIGTSGVVGLVTSAPTAVSSVVSALCLRAGLTAGQIDVTGLSTITRTVRSLALSQIASTRQALELLMSTYFFEMVVSDKIYFRPRGGASVATIPYLDLGASMGDDQPEPLALRQVNELEIPAQIALSYINVSDDYQTDTQYSDRLISATSGTVNTVQMAIGMTPAEAKAVADTMLLDQAASVISTPIALLGDYCRLEPTDPVTVTGADGSTFRLRLVKKTDSYPLLKFDAVLDDTSVLSSQGITSTDYTSSTVVAAATGTLMELLDIPILQDADDDAGFYVAAKGDAENYPGSAIFGSNDNVEYTRKATVLESAVFGTCTTTLGNWTGPRVFDEMNSVTVNVGDGTLASSTRAAILNSLSVNAMLVGSEMIQFHTATLVSAGVYTLTGLLRGGRGTEWAMVDHAVNERCVLLRGAGLRRIIQQNNDISLEKYYKGVTLGRTLSSATAETFTNNAVGLKPFAPFDLRATRSASGTVFTMQRRTRLAVRTIGPLGISIPMGEDEASYTLEIYDGSGYTTLKRTLTATTLSFSYAAADEITDFGSQQATYYCRAYQRSQQVGLGYKLQAAA